MQFVYGQWSLPIAPAGTDGGPFAEEDKANHLLSFEFVKSLLCTEDFPMAEQCQRGLAAGRERVVVGRNEPLLQHLHTVWADGMEGQVAGGAPVGHLASVRN
jgi:Ring hydroxylating alpha subunit (catalytic domain)